MSATTLLIVLVTLLALLYVAGIEWLARGVRAVLKPTGKSAWQPRVSVIVAARNEETGILACLRSVMASDYPDFEIVVVDDGSSDGTEAAIRSLMTGPDKVEDHLKVIRLNSGSSGSGKVAALACGIDRSSGEILVTLDADCHVGPRWLSTMIGCMAKEVGFVAGPVAYSTTGSFMQRLEALEFLSLISIGAGAIGIGKPLICNSANSAYRRTLYDSMIESLPPIDFSAADELLMHFVHESSTYDVAFCSSRDALVTTEGAGSLRAFLQQRMRWVGMVGHLPSGHRIALSTVFLFFALIPIFLVGGFWSTRLVITAAVALAAKAIVDYRVISPICRHFGHARLLRVFLPAEVLYIPYALFTAPLGTLLPTTWKGRDTAPGSSEAAPQPRSGR